MLGKNHHRVTRPTSFHLDVIDVHDFDITTSLPLCVLLFGTPSLNTLWACRYTYGLKCCRAQCGCRKCLSVASRHSIDYTTRVSTDAASIGRNLPRSISFFQLESFIWSSMTSLRCDVDIPLVLLVISLSGAQSVSMVSPSICRPPLIKLGEYLARQVS